MHPRTSSWPGSDAQLRATRPTSSLSIEVCRLDGRVKPGHDGRGLTPALLLLLSLLPIPALADTSADPETVVVTATRTPQPIDVTGESVSVITGDDLQTQIGRASCRERV